MIVNIDITCLKSNMKRSYKETQAQRRQRRRVAAGLGADSARTRPATAGSHSYAFG